MNDRHIKMAAKLVVGKKPMSSMEDNPPPKGSNAFNQQPPYRMDYEPMNPSRNTNKPPMGRPRGELNMSDMDSLSIDELHSLLSNFRSLSSEEQNALTDYLKKLEATNMKKVL